MRSLLLASLALTPLAGCVPSPPPARAPSAADGVSLPAAENALALADDAPHITVRGDAVLVDGAAVADTRAILASQRLQRVDGLFDALHALRAVWKGEHAGLPFPGVAVFYFDADTPAVVVKSVFQTAAFAGYPNGQLAVRAMDGSLGALSVDAQIPRGSIPPEAIQRVVRQNFGRFRACYEAGLAKNAQLGGRVAVRFFIGLSGAVRDVSLAETTMHDATVESCIVEEFKKLAFPKPEGGIVDVVYPIIFNPG